jgi:ribosomal protein S12 methylthiotransferase
MGQLLVNAGYHHAEAPEGADVLVVNTCGFIGPAKEESLQVLEEFAAEKQAGQVLIAAGCLTQRYGAEVARQVPGIDGILGTRRWMDILEVVRRLREGEHPDVFYHLPDTPTVGRNEHGVQRSAVQGKSAYIKIADGCRRPCAFCAIPLIKGTAVSRPLSRILDEARVLRDEGIKEIILIAQDTTDYGHDIGLRDGLAELLEGLVKTVPDIDWLRIMYAYPGYVTDRLIEIMASHEQIVPYLDMPLQHAHPKTLRRMRRPANLEWVRRTLQKMRSAMPDLALRTTFIVGYPGETDGEFQALLDFIEEIRFDRLGAFEFSFEPGTASEGLGDPIPDELKHNRWEQLMKIQQRISLELNHKFVGKTLRVLIEGQGLLEDERVALEPGTSYESKEISLGRTYRDAPEIDGMVIVEDQVPIGEMVPVRITGAMAYDLSGIVDSYRSGTINLEILEG